MVIAQINGDLTHLMIETRILIGRLVDWVDQAILYLHLNRVAPHSGDGAMNPWGQPSAWRSETGQALRRCGIRTASDLLVALDRTPDRDVSLQKLELSPAFVDSLRDGDWVCNILSWHCPDRPD
jgi:hypothetical protein